MEVQRLGNVAFSSIPHTPVKDTKVGNFVIPKGAVVISTLAYCHMRAFENPEDFNPERFLDEKIQLKKDSKFVPFSVDPRSCPGDNLAKTLKMFLMFTNILQRFHLVKANDNGDLYAGDTGITTIPKPFKIKFIPRN